MEVEEVIMRGVAEFSTGVSSSSEVLDRQHVDNGRYSEDLGVDILEDLDSYLEDIEDRLTISRMVNDSFIKGMVKAVEKMADDRIAEKETELARLKETIRFQQWGGGKIEGNGLNYGAGDFLTVHDKVKYSVCRLTSVTREQIERLRKERGISARAEDKLVDDLETTMSAMCSQVNDLVELSTESISIWWQEQEFRRDLEDVVVQTMIRRNCEEFEEKLWDQNVRLCSSQNVDWPKRINEVSNVKKELDSLLKSLPVPESGPLVSHGSNDFYRKLLSNHVSISSSFLAENGQSDECINGIPETSTFAQVKHLNKEGLVDHFNSIIAKMKRNHESKVQEMTEEYYTLKREYLKEKGSSVPLRKDKDLDMVRKKIPEFILKLDDIIVESEKLSRSRTEVDSFSSIKERVNSLVLENHQLRESLSDKKRELKNLTLQVSDANEKILRHSVAEENLLKLVGDLESAADDVNIKAFAIEEVYICVLTELAQHKNNVSGVSEMQSIDEKEVCKNSCTRAAQDAKANSKWEIEDSDVDLFIMRDLCELIFGEALKDANLAINDLKMECLHESENCVSLECKVMECEKEVEMAMEEKVRLKQEMDLVLASLDEKEKLRIELSAALTNEKQYLELAIDEINSLKDRVGWLQTSLNEREVKINKIEGEIAEALKQVELGKVEVNKVNQKLEYMSEELKKSNEQKNMLHATVQRKQNDKVLLEEKDDEQRRKLQSVIHFVHGLSGTFSEFEGRVTEDVKKKSSRLEELNSLLQSVSKKTCILKRTTSMYKQKLERRSADLETAENEVDLLGDQVDTLLNLLEKIYIGLDHYSPILQHYPGIMEILKLVKRELSGESVKFK